MSQEYTVQNANLWKHRTLYVLCFLREKIRLCSVALLTTSVFVTQFFQRDLRLMARFRALRDKLPSPWCAE